jgi:hypothetical protein
MNNTLRTWIGAVVGALAGYAVYHWIGCRTGACPLNSNPFVSMGIWGLMGALIAGKKGEQDENEQ